MKKIFFVLLVSSTLLLLSACNKEEAVYENGNVVPENTKAAQNWAVRIYYDYPNLYETSLSIPLDMTALEFRWLVNEKGWIKPITDYRFQLYFMPGNGREIPVYQQEKLRDVANRNSYQGLSGYFGWRFDGDEDAV